MKLLPLLLKEDIYGENAIVFHRTSVSDLINKVLDSGFKPGNGDTYGKGFYSTYDFDSQLEPQMRSRYGNIVVKFSCPTTNFFFCDWEEFKKTGLSKKLKATKDDFIFKQLDHYKIKYDDHIQSYLKYVNNETNSSLAKYVVGLQSFKSKVRGLVYTGPLDGKVLVSYDIKRPVPLSYTQDDGKTWVKVDKNLNYLKKSFGEKNKKLDSKIDRQLQKYGIDNYTINKDGTVDVDGNVDLSGFKLTKLPFIFSKVTGYFDCSDNELLSLEGSPTYVGFFFDCSANNLKSLKYAPKEVGGDFKCNLNKLTSLVHAPKKVSGRFECNTNELTTIEGSPSNVQAFVCVGNKLKNLIGGPKYCEEYFDCSYNQLTTLKGSPEMNDTGLFDCRFNNLTSLEYAPTNLRFNYVRYKKGNNIKGEYK